MQALRDQRLPMPENWRPSADSPSDSGDFRIQVSDSVEPRGLAGGLSYSTQDSAASAAPARQNLGFAHPKQAPRLSPAVRKLGQRFYGCEAPQVKSLNWSLPAPSGPAPTSDSTFSLSQSLSRLSYCSIVYSFNRPKAMQRRRMANSQG